MLLGAPSLVIFRTCLEHGPGQPASAEAAGAGWVG